jgi:hypothetical protein
MEDAKFGSEVKPSPEAVYYDSCIEVEKQVNDWFTKFLEAIGTDKQRSPSDIFNEKYVHYSIIRKQWAKYDWIHNAYINGIDTFKRACLEVYADNFNDYFIARNEIETHLVPHLILKKLDAWKKEHLSAAEQTKGEEFQASTKRTDSTNAEVQKGDTEYIVGVKKNVLSVPEIALLHYFKMSGGIVEPITSESRDEWGKFYNVDGHYLYQKYLHFIKKENRIGSNESKRKDQALINHFENILPLLKDFPDALNKANDEYSYLKSLFNERYKSL